MEWGEPKDSPKEFGLAGMPGMVCLVVMNLPACRCLYGLSLALGLWVHAQAAPPNVLLILADDVGQEVLGCYGGTSYPTPRLDTLASQGMLCEHAYSMPVCHPTRITLLTGRYPRNIGDPGWGKFPVQMEASTLAQGLRQAGYRTAVAGKWQLTLLAQDPRHAEKLGFQDSAIFGWHEGPRYHEPMIYENGLVRSDTQGRYGPDLYTDFLIDFMAKEPGKPFFAFYSMALCHDVTDDLDQPVPYGPRGRYDSYAEMAAAMDVQVGKMLDALKRLGLEDQTLVVFTGDNGTAKRSIIRYENGKYLRDPVVSRKGEEVIPGGKGNFRDDGTRVPLLMRLPGVIPPGSRSSRLVDFSDFLPTFLEVAGIRKSWLHPTDGKSFADLLGGTGEAPREWAYSELRGTWWVRTHDYKLYNDGRFYACGADPTETTPLDPNAGNEASRRARILLQAAAQKLSK